MAWSRAIGSMAIYAYKVRILWLSFAMNRKVAHRGQVLVIYATSAHVVGVSCSIRIRASQAPSVPPHQWKEGK